MYLYPSLRLCVNPILSVLRKAQPALTSVSGCVKALRVIVQAGKGAPYVKVGKESVIFGKQSLHINPRKVCDTYAFSPEDWAKWEKVWALLVATARGKASALVFYDNTTHVVSTVPVAFGSRCR